MLMQASFLGHLVAHGEACLPEDLTSAATTRLLDGGFVASSGAVEMARDGDLLCVACGRARFEPGAPAHENKGLAGQWLSAYRTYGNEAPSRVRGRFVVVILNQLDRSAWAATDRFGIHPLCFAADAAGFRFSDRADAIGREAKLSAQALFDYLYFHVIPAPTTVFEGVQRLPAGHWVHWRQQRTECRPYWVPSFHEPNRDDFQARRAEFIHLVRQAVESEVTPEVTGAFLSGGTDSSTVCGMLAEVTGAPVRTYSIGFDAEGYDEMVYARIAAQRFATDHHEYYMTPVDVIDGISKLASHYDQPFGNSSAVPAWICARRAKEDGVTKMLAGDGGDELFGGNSRYAKQRLFGMYGQVPPLLRMAALEPLLALPGMDRMPLVKKGVSYVQQARVPMPDRMQMYNMIERLGLANVFEPGFLAAIDRNEPLRAQRAVWTATRADTLINRMLAYDWKYTLADSDLPKVIGATQLAGVDVGFPLLADDLLEFSTRLPPEWKLRRFRLRWFFKEALRGFLPDEIITKKKHGFGLPFGVWAGRHDGLQRLTADALNTFKSRGIVRPRFVEDLLREHMPTHPQYYGEMAWILIMLEFWMRVNAPDWRLDA